MNERKLKLLRAFTLLGIVLIFLGAILKIQNIDFSGISAFLLMGMIFSFVAWIMILIYIINRLRQDRILWILFMFILPSLASLIFVWRDKRHFNTA